MLTLERQGQEDETAILGPAILAPVVDEDYWEYRVRFPGTDQAVVGFPKFFTIGIGFAKEDDWNTNLPYTCDTDKIVNHIWHNHGDDSITREMVAEAVSLIQNAAREDRD